MSQSLFLYAGFSLLGTFISSIAQVLLKKAAQRTYASVIQEYLNPRVIGGYAIFVAATLMSVFAYKVIPLSMGPILEATGYVWVTIFGVTIFGEQMSRKKALALMLIIAGIAIYSLGV